MGLAGLLALPALLAPAWLGAALPSDEAPVLRTPVPRGTVLPVGLPAPGRAEPKVVDGAIGDWVGQPSGLGGTAVLDRGEYIYQDFLFDDRGADDGKDARRLQAIGALMDREPGAARLEALSQAMGAQFDLGPADPTGGVLVGREAYGDARYPEGAEGHADLLELRVAADAQHVYVLARFVTMRDPSLPALLVLADTQPGSSLREVPFGSGLVSERAERALLLTAGGAWMAELDTQEVTELTEARVAVEPSGYANALEAALPRALLEGEGFALAAAAGVADGARLAPVATGEGRGQVLNAAFRGEDVVSIWMEQAQALALLQGSLDPFFARIDAAWLEQGMSQAWRPGPGYHERVFVSSEGISEEEGRDGLHQPYGLYIPGSWDPGEAVPLTFWLPWRNARAHTHAAWAPRLLEQLGEERGSLVVSPRGRGETLWGMGEAHQDFLEVWDDVHRTFVVDAERRYLSGLSMGGFGSYLFGLLYPDRFAAVLVVAGPLTQGAWGGVDPDGADTVSQNEGDAPAALVYRLAENARNLPFVVYHGSNDQSVPAGGVARLALRFQELGYRHRVYVFPGYEHHTHVVVDDWGEAARYFDLHRGDPDPERVVYKVVPALERAVETVHAGGAALDFRFDGAYWLSGLAVRDANPEDPRSSGLADVRTLARPRADRAVPEAGASLSSPGQSTPWTMEGLRWEPLPPEAPRNGFEARFEGVEAATLDLVRMGLDASQPLELRVTSDSPLRLRLLAPWRGAPGADGAPAEWENGSLVLDIAGGEQTVRLLPAGELLAPAGARGVPGGGALLALAALGLACLRRRA